MKRILAPILLALTFTVMFLSPVFAGPKIENYKRQLRERLVSSPTDVLIWMRSMNNTYLMFCKTIDTKEHRFYSKFTSPIITKYIAIDAMERSDWGYSGELKYGFR